MRQKLEYAPVWLMVKAIGALPRPLARAAGVTRAAERAPARMGEQRRSCIDPRAALAAIGWKPEVAIDEGLARTMEYFRKQRG